MKFLAITCVLCYLLCGCASRAPVVQSVPRLPKPPERIDIMEKGKTEIPGVKYIDPAAILKEGESYVAPKAGAAVCSPRTWRGAKYAIEEWPKWGEAVQSIVKGYQPEEKRPWWKLW